MSSELVNMDEFKEYRPLGSKRKSAKHYLVFFVHLVVAVLFFVTQLMNGFGTWFYGTGIVTPILLIINGYSYYYLENGLWYREEMIPFISRIVTTTEIETDRYCQFHTRIASIFLVLGWISIILCNILCTIGLVVFVPLFTAEDLLTRIIGELVAYAVIFGPYFLYFLLLLGFSVFLDKIFISRYSDIKHLVEIENQWTRENRRRMEAQKHQNETP